MNLHSQKVRMAAVIAHPNQHISPLFDQIAGLAGIDLKVFYASGTSGAFFDPDFKRKVEWDVPLVKDHAYVDLSKATSNKIFPGMLQRPLTILSHLHAWNPHLLLLFGYTHPEVLAARAWGAGRAAILHLGDSIAHNQNGFFKESGKGLLLRWFFGAVDACLTIGDQNELFYKKHGIPSERIFRAGYPIDAGRLLASVKRDAPEWKRTLREKLNLPVDGVIFTIVGKIYERKRPLDLLRAAHLVKERKKMFLWFIGDGEQKQELEEEVRRLGLSPICKVQGFMNQSEIPNAFAASDVCVVCSSFDNHPLVVTEAALFKNALIVSDRIGCIGPTDTAQPGGNALVYPCGNIESLAGALSDLLSNEARRQKYGEVGYAIALDQDASAVAQRIAKTIPILYERRPKVFRDIEVSTVQKICFSAEQRREARDSEKQKMVGIS